MKIVIGAGLAALLSLSPAVLAANEADLQAIRAQIQELKQNYEQRIAQLEQRLQQAEANHAENPAPIVSAASPASSENSFNPAISLILSGSYGQLQRDPEIPVTGFTLSPNNNGYTKGFSLKESEIGISANIDPQFRGVGTFSLDPAGGISVENAFVQTSALGNGLNLKFGRYFSGLGYLNEQHSHTWDFADQPLVYRVFWNNQLGEDGVQLKWLAPSDRYIELGGELNRGLNFPGTHNQNNGSGASVLFLHLGDDIGIENSWRAGVSWYQTGRENAQLTSNSPAFSGDSHTAGLDLVWKYSPKGNISQRYLKLQGEYFRRSENGLLTYTPLASDHYSVTQSGWYLQTVLQFAPAWRTGLRYDQLDPGVAVAGANIAGNVLSHDGFYPARVSWMTDYNPSEFTRLRLQYALDKSRQGLTDNQLFLQYIVSMGAHGAHQY